ncbi:MAG TPA: styrene monooxygenase/indole monooxygenase family protein [Gaiellaceae bacterium]|nr:styrene monooxygenase/indole monooxygenase family protein [Gaiellaceae bacterium]
MRKIAVVGAGQAGLLAAHALRKHDYDVTLYSDKTPDDFLTKARPTGVAARFDMALEFERELGLDHWSAEAPPMEGVHLHFLPKKGNVLVTLLGRVQRPGAAIDLRMQSARWMEELEQRGGRVEIEDVSVERLEEIAKANDLVLVAAGRGEITRLFPRDEQRSTYREPQRFLAMVCAEAPVELPYAPWVTPVKFNFFAEFGEAFWVPWYSKGKQRCWGMLVEAKAGGPFDRFRECKSAEEVLRTSLEVIREYMPWDYEVLRDAVPADENAWLVGQFTPEVRQVVGTLPSGREVMAVGDTAHSLDPIGGQGANNGNKMVRVVVDAIVERGEQPFDAGWMRAAHDRFWERHRFIEQFNNTLLEPLTPAGRDILMAQYGSDAKPGNDSPQQRLADLFFENFNDPRILTEAFHDRTRARAVIEECFGSARTPILRGGLRIARGQLRQKLGRPAGHPGTLPDRTEAAA